MFWFMVFVFDAWTGGEDGLTGINRLAVLGYALRDHVPFYYFVYAWFVGATIVLWRIVHSPFGQVIRAIRQSETRARAVGYDTARYKWAVFTLSCGFAGLAGGLYALARFGAFAEPMSLSAVGQRGPDVPDRRRASPASTARCSVSSSSSRCATCCSTLTDHWMLAYGVLFMASSCSCRKASWGSSGGSGSRTGSTTRAWPRRPARASPRRPPPAGRAGRGRTVTGASPGAAGPAPVLETRGLRKAFGGHVVLDGVDLAFERGRLSALIGPNGAGKTTCFNLLTGFLAADAGAVRFNGRDITACPRTAGRASGSAGRSRFSTSSTTTRCSRTCRVAVPAMRARGFDCWTARRFGERGGGPGRADRAPDRARRAGARRGAATSPTASGACSRSASRSPGEPELLLLDEPTSGLGMPADGDAPRARPAALRAGSRSS